MELDYEGRHSRVSPSKSDLLSRALMSRFFRLAAVTGLVLSTLAQPTKISAQENPTCNGYFYALLLTNGPDDTPDPLNNIFVLRPYIKWRTPETNVSVHVHNNPEAANSEPGWTLLQRNLLDGNDMWWPYRSVIKPGKHKVTWEVRISDTLVDSQETNPAGCKLIFDFP